jgi:hypothetical protein
VFFSRHVSAGALAQQEKATLTAKPKNPILCFDIVSLAKAPIENLRSRLRHFADYTDVPVYINKRIVIVGDGFLGGGRMA